MRSATLLWFLGTALAAPSKACGSCKAYPGTEAWPTRSEWTALNDTISGRLIQPILPGGVCHEDQPNFDEAECPTRQSEWASYDWHSTDPVSVMYDNAANWTCLPDPKDPCTGEGYPAYVINATTTEHVKAGVDFARDNNIRLVVKASGHDFLGRSVAPGSLSIWMHHYDNVEFHAGSFQLNGTDSVFEGDSISCGGGTSMYSLYQETDKHNTTVVGGGAKSVSVGGYISGGGHSMLSPDYGLAADNVIEMEVVTPLGDVLVANKESNNDLYWALLGGGGSTFGVVTRFTIKAHPTPKMQFVTFMAATSPSNPMAADIVTFLASQFPDLNDAGLRGYGFMTMTGFDTGVEGVPTEWAGISGAFTVVNQSVEYTESLFTELNNTLLERSNGTGSVTILPVRTYNTFMEYFDERFDAGNAGSTALLKSRLLDRRVLTNDLDALKAALMAVINVRGLMHFYPLAGKAVHEAANGGRDNSVNPGWRSAYVHALTSMGFEPFNRTAEKEAQALLKEAWEPMVQLTPGMGSYINEAAYFEENPAETFWGDNYERLLQIKREVDPMDVMWCPFCVGHEHWEQRENGQLCRLAGPSRMRFREN
ncbi:FAD binding domain-containing protein [Emericellopsis atlantica]|uniref:FAD binding domain-containing protein n=1 Tax=Emericellopsis atlantica TaxID=2614577 RepID=A0A9P7ZKH3_9HYPO|nr:FAD binding domain-containing protein [Emericellopsis atlantica]KAG9253779.1 FAD binding domain-containing protein [Emericellopsis atlantica]